MKSLSQIKTGKKENITIITDEIIESITKTKLFNDNEMDTRLWNLHKDLLRESKNRNKCKEVGVIWNLRKLEQIVCVHGIDNGVDFRKNDEANDLLNSPYKNSIVVLHNHPRNWVLLINVALKGGEKRMQRTSFLPLGNKMQTEKEIELNIKRQELSEYYGVPFGVFDSYDEDKQESEDKAKAQALILEGKEIPDDLKERLLQYKKLANEKIKIPY